MLPPVEVLVSVTQTYARVCYGDDAVHKLPKIIRMVKHCNQLFNFDADIRHQAVSELQIRWGL